MPLLKRFYQDPYLHIRSFSLHLLASAALCALLYSVRTPEFFSYAFAWWHPLLILPAIYVGGLSAVFIHNACHGSFKPRWMNVVAGEVAGVHQLWGFMGWKLIHLMHHHYSDDLRYDPHPPADYTFAQFMKHMFLKSSQKVTERYREHYGETKRTIILHRILKPVFLAMAACNALLWFLLLGPVGFVWFYLPSYAFNHWIFSHVNYYSHPKDENGKTYAVNRDDTLYHKIGNFLWFGLYYHGNHHRKPLLFNPKKVPARAPRDVQEKLAA
jgi:stearoyl-CoA desaturase (delta-9 desaturase)